MATGTGAARTQGGGARCGHELVLPLGCTRQTLPPTAGGVALGRPPTRGHLAPSTYKMHTLRTTHLMRTNGMSLIYNSINHTAVFCMLFITYLSFDNTMQTDHRTNQESHSSQPTSQVAVRLRGVGVCGVCEGRLARGG